MIFQHSATVSTEELLPFENEKLKATIENLGKCVDPADTIKYRPKDSATQFNYLIPLRVNKNLLLIVWFI